jgi:hypothetical protein
MKLIKLFELKNTTKCVRCNKFGLMTHYERGGDVVICPICNKDIEDS